MVGVREGCTSRLWMAGSIESGMPGKGYFVLG
jgi:hypothetical protein